MNRQQKMRSELERVLRLLIEKYKANRIILFGSMMNEKLQEPNDVDLVIIKDTDKKFTDRIGEVINLCRPRVAMDFIVYTPEEFQKLLITESFIQNEVVAKGRVLYEIN